MRKLIEQKTPYLLRKITTNIFQTTTSTIYYLYEREDRIGDYDQSTKWNTLVREEISGSYSTIVGALTMVHHGG